MTNIFFFQVDGLETEVSALKALVITSTPSMPNKHSYQSHHRATSDTNVGDVSHVSPGSPGARSRDSVDSGSGDTHDKHFDPVIRQEYLSWKKSPVMNETDPFLSRIYQEDINPCLTFPATELSSRVRVAVHENNMCLIPVKPDTQENPRNCALLQQPRTVKYKILFDGDKEEFYICQLARNRIASVCDFLTYCRCVVTIDNL